MAGQRLDEKHAAMVTTRKMGLYRKQRQGMLRQV
jgi:hypothetical protein